MAGQPQKQDRLPDLVLSDSSDSDGSVAIPGGSIGIHKNIVFFFLNRLNVRE